MTSDNRYIRKSSSDQNLFYKVGRTYLLEVGSTRPILTLVLALLMLEVPTVADEVNNLISDLKYGTSDVRAEAAVSLGLISDQRGVDLLILALKDEDFVVRSVAVDSLVRIGGPRAVSPLIEALKDEDSFIRALAAWALGEIGDERAISALTYVAQTDKEAWVREAAAKALEKILATQQEPELEPEFAGNDLLFDMMSEFDAWAEFEPLEFGYSKPCAREKLIDEPFQVTSSGITDWESGLIKLAF